MGKNVLLMLVFFFFLKLHAAFDPNSILLIDDSLKNNTVKRILNEFRSKENLKEKINYLFKLEEYQIGWVYPYLKDSLEDLKRRVYMKIVNPEARFKISWIESNIASYNNNLPQSIYLLENALNLYCLNKSDSEMVVKKLVYLSSNTMDINNLIYYNTLYKNHLSPEKKYLVNESEIFYKFGQYQKAIHLRYEELKDIVKTDTFYRFHLHNDLGIFFSKLKKYDSSFFHYRIAQGIADNYLAHHPHDKRFTFLKNLVGGNLAHLLYTFGNYKEAIPLLKKDFYYSVASEEWLSAFNSSSLLALCYQLMGDVKLSDRYLDTSKKLLSEHLRYHHIARKNYYKTVSQIQGFRKNYPIAYANLKKFYDLDDSINEKQKGNLNLYESLMYEIKLKNKELSNQSEILKLSKESEIKSRNLRSYGIFVFFVLIVMVFYMFRINFKLRKREQELEFKNLKIQTQNNTIQNSLKEKDLLIKEVHHRVKNNLQLIISIINLQKSKGVTPETQSILDDLKYRIFSISNAHQMLYQRNSIQSVNIKDYLISILKNLESTSEKPIQLDYSFDNTDDVFMGLDIAILLGLLINEMFTNSLKYASREGKNTEIKLHFYKDPYRDKFKMRFSDNGPGLSDNFENIIQKNQSTGLELIYMLVQNLSGKLSVNSQNGLEYILEFEVQSRPSDASE